MSTRSTTHFIDSSYIDPTTNKPYLGAIVYRHSDGYPKGAGVDLFKFLKACKKLKDSRLNDTSYLAARYVVFLGQIFAYDYKRSKDDKYVEVPRKNRLDFISVGICMSDPGDIEYRYVVDCGKIDAKTGLPEVKCFKVSVKDDGTDHYCIETAIPRYTKVAPQEDVVMRREVHSLTNPTKTYTVEYNVTQGTFTCTCPRFKFAKECKHLYRANFAA